MIGYHNVVFWLEGRTTGVNIIRDTEPQMVNVELSADAGGLVNLHGTVDEVRDLSNVLLNFLGDYGKAQRVLQEADARMKAQDVERDLEVDLD